VLNGRKGAARGDAMFDFEYRAAMDAYELMNGKLKSPPVAK
jgi:hypothetical protein